MNNNWLCMTKGDKNAFLNIYEENYQKLFSYGYSLTCDKDLTKDCIQEVFMEIWNTRITLKSDVNNVQAYLFTWLRRKISSVHLGIQREAYFHSSFNIYDENEHSYEDLLVAFQNSKERREKLAKALNNLTPKQVEMVRLKFFEKLTYAQIAEKTNLTTHTIYNTIFLAIQLLRKEMGSYF